MDERLKALLHELYRAGEANDARVTDRSGKMLNITPETGEFLSLMIQAVKARSILEVGTSNGYSTLWLADAARYTGGHVTTLELSPEKAELARANFERAGLADRIALVVGDAGEHLRQAVNGAYDLIFLDSERTLYLGWWLDLQRVLAPGGLIIVDNALSHASEIAPFRSLVEATPGYEHSLLPLGKGEWLILKQG
ncbi:MAG: O-methyltransferase [Bacillota bacterium]